MKLPALILSGLSTLCISSSADLPLGEDQARRLMSALDQFYRDGSQEVFKRGAFHGRSTVLIALARLVRRTLEPIALDPRRAAEMLDWVQVLSRSVPDAGTSPFVDQQISRHLATLLEHFRDDELLTDQVVVLIDRAWAPEHLPALARLAGRAHPAEARGFLDQALALDEWPGDAVKRTLTVIRAVERDQRTPEQWALLGLSGQATAVERAMLLVQAAHAYARRDAGAAIFDRQHPLRAVLEQMITDHRAGESSMEQALLKAAYASNLAGDRESSVHERQNFFRALSAKVLLDPTDPSVTFVPPVALLAPPRMAAGNVVYPRFGCAGALGGPDASNE